MSQQIQAYSINAPGFYGLNTQDSSLDLASGYALTATNCVIDQYGRIGARKGWTPSHSTLAALGSSDVKAIGELITLDGTSYIICAGNNKLFKLVGTTLSELTYGGGGTAPTITASNWQMASLGGGIYLFQEGYTPLEFNPTTSTTQYRRISEMTSYAGTVQLANAVISAYGRLWNVGTTTDKVTIQWCDTKQPYDWAAGLAGTLDTTTVWPKGGDVVVGLGAHNGFLFVFGKNNILVYSGATDPSASTFLLHDVITGIGCVARDSIANTGSDIIFLSQTGVRSLQRTIQEKSAPLRELSKNVRNDLIAYLNFEVAADIKAVHSPLDAFYLLSLPVAKQVYCFDTKAQLQDGAARVTTWDSIEPKSFCAKQDGTLLLGKAGYIGSYTGYLDNGSTYQMQYHTNHTDFGAPSVTSILKSILVTVIGGNGQALTIKWAYDFTGNFYPQNVTIPSNTIAYYGQSEYNYGFEYSSGQALSVLKAYPTGSGKVVQTGFDAYINGSPLSIQKVEILAKNGKILSS
jgi:hypothetical protein